MRSTPRLGASWSFRSFFLTAALVAGAPVSAAPPSASSGLDVVERWQPYELWFYGPQASEADSSPNPFMDFRLQVTFTAPSGNTFEVPGFYDGNGSGGGTGKVWKARFSADEVGAWTWTASFRTGTDVAISTNPGAGTPTAFDGASGSFGVVPEAEDAEGFYAKGRLEYVGEHYLRFRDGDYFLKSGTDSPENLLGYSGFDNVQDKGGLSTSKVHDYAPHVADWRPGDPFAGAAGSPSGLKGIVGALNYLSSVGVNAVYFLPMNLGGDAQDTTPFLGYSKTAYDKTHYDTSRLTQWNTVFEHATKKGIQLQFVLSETEPDNEKWLDNGQLGRERKLFFRELVARFAHNLAIKWNLGEENDYSVPLLTAMASYLADLDAYDHPIAVHTHADDFSDYFALVGKANFTNTSIQYLNPLGGGYVEDWRDESAAAGKKWVIDMDENGTPFDGVSDKNAAQMRREILYDVYFSGGQVEWYLGSKGLPLGGDQSLEDFRSREEMWDYTRYARELMENHLDFWMMEPADHLLNGESSQWGGGEVFTKPGRDFAIYLPDASPSGNLDLTGAGGLLAKRWFNPRTGVFEGNLELVYGGSWTSLGSPPSSPNDDWVCLFVTLALHPDVDFVSYSATETQTLFLDAGPEHAFEKYQLLGCLDGSVPGTVVFDLLLPLNWDHWTDKVLAKPGYKAFSGFKGVLDAQGKATATIEVGPENFAPSLVGATIYHAYLAGNDYPTWASNPVPLMVLP